MEDVGDVPVIVVSKQHEESNAYIGPRVSITDVWMWMNQIACSKTWVSAYICTVILIYFLDILYLLLFVIFACFKHKYSAQLTI